MLVRMPPGARGLMGELRLRNINMNLLFCLPYRLREYSYSAQLESQFFPSGLAPTARLRALLRAAARC